MEWGSLTHLYYWLISGLFPLLEILTPFIPPPRVRHVRILGEDTLLIRFPPSRVQLKQTASKLFP